MVNSLDAGESGAAPTTETWPEYVRRISGGATQAQIAERIGAHHVVYPEADMGRRVAHLVTGRMMDYIEFEDGFAIAKINAPEPTLNKSLAASQVRERFGVTVVGVKRTHEDFQHATPSTVPQAGDLLIVSGPTKKVEAFAAFTGKR